MTKRIILNAFDMTCVSHQSAGTWRHPSSQAWRYNEIDYWTNMARELERGFFDCLFIADVVGVYDVYRGTAEMALRDAAQVPVNDPFASISAMAAVTQHLGFGVTSAEAQSDGFITYGPAPGGRQMAAFSNALFDAAFAPSGHAEPAPVPDPTLANTIAASSMTGPHAA